MKIIATLGLLAVLAGCAGGPVTAPQTGPSVITPPDSPNWALAAPREVKTNGPVTHEVPVFATGPDELLGYLDEVVLSDARTEMIDPSWTATGPARSYVQRSRVFGFPDEISVEAVDLGTGDAGQRASLLIYSASVYGYSDLGVNAARLERWLTRLSLIAPEVAGRGLER